MRKTCIKTLITCVVFLFCLVLSSCNAIYGKSIAGVVINESDELVIVYSDGSEQNLGVVKGERGENGANGKDGSLVINTSGSSIPAASAKGLRSAVSIVCNFQATVQLGGWRPGSGNTTTKNYTSEGSGVIYKIDKSEGDAFIITNYHVVYDASSNTENGISDDISIYLYGSELEEMAIEATYVGGSLYYDIAVLRVEDSEILKASDASEVSISDSDTVVPGESAIAVGNAQGLGISCTSGIVSVDSEYITMTAVDGKTAVSFRVMRVDTAINSGNSGGGLYDEDGNLIGIVNAKIVYEGVENIGYAIPSNVVASIAENIIDYCYGTDVERVQRALIGITVSASDSRIVYDAEEGLCRIVEKVFFYEINEGSLADGVLEVGDAVTSASINGVTREITRQYQIIDMMLDLRVGDTVNMNIVRDGVEMTVSITITEDCLVAY